MAYIARTSRKGIPACEHKTRKVVALGLCGSCYNRENRLKGRQTYSGLCPTCKVNPRKPAPNGGSFGQCAECKRATEKEWRMRNPEQWAKTQRKARLKREYGITPEEYQAMFDFQNGRCPICNIEMTLGAVGAPDGAVLDHDHATDAIRDLLCNLCNIALGSMRDNPDLLQRAIEYLVKHGKALTT